MPVLAEVRVFTVQRAQRGSLSAERQRAVPNSRKQKASLANLPGAYVTWQKLVPDVRGLFFSVRTWISFSGHPLSGGWNSVVTPLLSFWVFAAGAMTPDLNLFFVRKTFLSIFWATQTQSHGVRVEVDEVNTTASRVSRGVKGCLAELN